MRLALGMSLAALLALVGCGDDDGPTTDAGGDVGMTDTGGDDAGGDDAGGDDAGGDDAGGDDAGGDDAGSGCESDSECTEGEEWCVDGECVECDNSGLLCDIACTSGWTVYTRNGCSPCECAPANACTSDDECEGGSCLAGEFCWDWCPAGDPTCCFGNLCVTDGCEGPPPSGCFARGCPQGATCQDFGVTGECVPSGCSCDSSSGAWICTADCNGGSCVLPD